jgi:hypothetical protein
MSFIMTSQAGIDPEWLGAGDDDLIMMQLSLREYFSKFISSNFLFQKVKNRETCEFSYFLK